MSEHFSSYMSHNVFLCILAKHRFCYKLLHFMSFLKLDEIIDVCFFQRLNETRIFLELVLIYNKN